MASIPQTEKGRTTICDKCGKTRSGCIWIRRDDSQRSYVLCEWCRRAWQAYGVPMTHVDQDFPQVAL